MHPFVERHSPYLLKRLRTHGLIKKIAHTYKSMPLS